MKNEYNQTTETFNKGIVMGLHLGMSNSSYDNHQWTPLEITKQNFKNPDPKNFEIISTEQIGECLVVHIRYPNCTNYEGVKILVYQNVDTQDLLKQGSLDPHFSDNRQFHSPIARFAPTVEGMLMAKLFAIAAIK